MSGFWIPVCATRSLLLRIEQLLCCNRALRVFWDVTIGMYSGGDLPQKFLERGVWLTRAKSYMELVEPIEISNMYRLALWKQWGVGRRHYIEGKRPKRFEFIEAQFVAHYPGEALAPVLARARREADAVDFAELRAAGAGAKQGPATEPNHASP